MSEQARRVEKKGRTYIETEERKTAMLSKVRDAFARGASDAVSMLQEYLHLEQKLQRYRRELGQYFTARVDDSNCSQVLNLIDAKPDKVWPRSTVVARMTEAHPECDPVKMRDSVDDSLRRLVREHMIERVGFGLYQSTKEAGDGG